MVRRALIYALSILVFVSLAITDSAFVSADNNDELEVITASNAHRIERLRTIGIRDVVPSWVRAIFWEVIVFSPNGHFIATYPGWGGYVRILSIKTGNEVATFNINTAAQYATFSPDSTKIAIVGIDYRLWVWSITTGKLMWITSPVTSKVQFNATGTLLAGGSLNETVLLWDVQTGKQVVSLTGKQSDSAEFRPALHQVTLQDVVFSPNGDQLVATNYITNINRPVDLPVGGVLVWDINSQQLLHELRGNEYTLAWWVSFNSAGVLNVVSVSKTKDDKDSYDPKGKIISFWDIEQTKSIASFEIDAREINDLVLSTTARFIATIPFTYIWDVQAQNNPIAEVRGWPYSFNKDDTLLMTSCKLVTIKNGQSVSEIFEDTICDYNDNTAYMVDASFSPDGALLAILQVNNRVQLWGVRQNN